MSASFKYISFVCDVEELDHLLNKYGAEGWRLHTCEPVVIVGQQGIGTLRMVVVLDKMYADAEPDYQDSAASEGIAMKG